MSSISGVRKKRSRSTKEGDVRKCDDEAYQLYTDVAQEKFIFKKYVKICYIESSTSIFFILNGDDK